MSLFLLYVTYPYEGGYVYGVYSSKEEAEKYLNADDITSPDRASIQEITLDQFVRIEI